MSGRRKPAPAESFNKGTLINLAAIFGGLLLSGTIYVIGNWYLYGDTLHRHDVVISKLADTVSTLNTTVAVLGEQNKQIASILAKMNDGRR